ncbi:hypothetical protein [Staphylococcus aureus]|uniref:hypothetical protein n=1 Tax=Staphylococcus aureus TaxID=1280 RepID=UPI00338EF7FB
MKLRLGKKVVMSICLILSLCVMSGYLSHNLIGQNVGVKYVKAVTDEELEKNKSNDKNDSESKKDESTKKSYASFLFDKTDKNQSMMYFNSQTGADVPTVESVIQEKAGSTNGTQYAAFLNTLGQWNLYNTYTSQIDAGVGIVGKIIRVLVGVILLICLYIMDAIDGLLQITADLVDYLNVFKYLVDGQGNIPTSNPLHVLQPLVDLYKELTVFAKIFIAILLGFTLFRVATMGTRRSKGHYLGRGLGKFTIAALTLTIVPLMLSGFFGIFADLIRSDKGVAKSTIDDIPSHHIVNTRSYIDSSLAQLKGKNNNDAINGGYVLLHDHKDMPKTEKEVEDKIPTASLIKYLNTGNTKNKSNLSGKELVWKWMKCDTFTADDVDSMYSLSKDDKSHGWAFWENDEKRAFQFKLAYGPESVKTFDGKDPFSLDLNGVSIQSASLAGNGPMGILLNGISMTAIIVATTVVVITLILAIFSALLKSLGLLGSNLGLASIGSPQGFFGIGATIIMLIVAWISALAIIPIYTEVTNAVQDYATSAINDKFDMSGLAKQTLSTVGILFGQWFCAILALKSRGALMKGVEDFFKSVIDRISAMTGTQSRGRNRGAEALNAMNEADKAGYANNLDRMTAPIDKAKDTLGNIPAAAMGYGAGKLSNAANSIKDIGTAAGKAGLDRAKESASNLKSKFMSEDEVVDNETQGQGINEHMAKGLSDMSKSGVSNMSNNIADQDRAVDKAQQKYSDLAEAKKGLKDAQSHYEDLKNSGASKVELAQAQEDIDRAQEHYDNALAHSQASARDMAGTGISAASIAEGKKSTAKDFQQANRDVVSAKNELASLKEERQQMMKGNATQDELSNIDREINMVEDRLASAKDRQALAKAGYAASIGNAQVEKDSRNDVVAARQSEREAARLVESAKHTGNISAQEQDVVRKTAGAMSDSITKLRNYAQNDLSKAENARGALKYMSNNHNQAFTDTDKENISTFANDTSQNVEVAKQELDNAKKGNASKSYVASLSQRVMDANKLQASAQTVLGAIESGHVTDQAITAQEQIVASIANEKVQAEKEMANLNQASGNGETISRGVYHKAQSNLNTANQRAQVANKTLSSLHAMKAAGTNQLSGSQMDRAVQQAEQQISEAQNRHNTLKEASNAINHVNTGGQINRDNLMKIVNGQKLVQQASSQRADLKRSEFKKVDTKLATLKSQLANGKPVGLEVQRMQNNYDRIEKELIQIENQEKAVRSSGRTFKNTGRSMVNNLKVAQENLVEKQNLKVSRETEYQEILKTGGYTQEQLANLSKEANNNRVKLEKHGNNYARERKNEVAKIQEELKRADSIMNEK